MDRFAGAGTVLVTAVLLGVLTAVAAWALAGAAVLLTDPGRKRPVLRAIAVGLGAATGAALARRPIAVWARLESAFPVISAVLAAVIAVAVLQITDRMPRQPSMS